MSDLIFKDWGLNTYETALAQQASLVDKVHAENLPGFLIFCSHPPVVTLGRATQDGDVFAWQGPQIEVSRGGRATYHGPSQLVIYPILNLTHARKGRAVREVVGYLRTLEESLVEVLHTYKVQAQGRSLQKKNSAVSGADETGVWIGAKKLASIGVAVRKWVTYHGAAINLTQDPLAFQGLNPCGFTSDTMVSLEEVLQTSIDVAEFKEKMRRHLIERL